MSAFRHIDNNNKKAYNQSKSSRKWKGKIIQDEMSEKKTTKTKRIAAEKNNSLSTATIYENQNKNNITQCTGTH